MTSRDFCFWLQGFFELNAGKDELTPEQANKIRAHLSLVFLHEIDPAMGGKVHQSKLNEIHGTLGPTPPPGQVVMRC